ncbi:hypothetical protein GPJ56_008177 [Histomonas meleagridis]|uniref:uncharacterized protein n=1 Tax=Histomonas meleagridis TaxID=135588 RepID=UPI003559AF0D|nr:hypothetical protein GPJ56_008177 [Histomonas meleagridis]KAH0797198.1 hypothetical protein GO595_009880 [Histomonas meleagridis]
MSERQRLITTYTARLSNLATVCYSLHFLRGETDSAAKAMIIENLRNLENERSNRRLCENAVAAERGESRIIFGKKEKKGGKQSMDSEIRKDQGKKTPLLKAIESYHNLYVEDALKYFSKAFALEKSKSASVGDKYYKARAECNLALRRFKEAVILAEKAKTVDILFACSIADNQFELAASLIPKVINILVTIRSGQKLELFISPYEIVILIIIVTFATRTTSEAQDILAQAFEYTNYEYPVLVSLGSDFTGRNFKSFVSGLSDLCRILGNSYYTHHNVKEIISAIRSNVISNFVRLYSEVPLKTIQEETGIPLNEALSHIRSKIRLGEINGKIDFQNNNYIGGVQDLQARENYEFLNRTVILREQFQNNQWKAEYNYKRKRNPKI